MKVRLFILNSVVIVILLLLLGKSDFTQPDRIEQVRVYTRNIEFDYINWTLNALFLKGVQTAVGAPRSMSLDQQHQLVMDQMKLVDQINQANAMIEKIYANPEETDPSQSSAAEVDQLQKLKAVEQNLQPISETILQQQVSSILSENGLTLGGQPIPPVLFHSTPLPLALIISPRNVIRQDANISLIADLSTPDMVSLEQEVEKNMNVSALVVPVGGVGIYPTMVMSTTNLPWLAEVISHEWTHNFLTLRPLGLNYETSPELRTINETTASIVGKEIGQQVLRRYYPERVKAEQPQPAPTRPPKNSQPTPAPKPAEPPPFDYRAEMHTTRVTADQLLAEGKTKEAEDYMEARRRIFWENGYQIRKINQAYFAFYGAYADVPGGEAGADPVGPAVRELRARSASLADFLNRISWITSFEQLQQLVK